MGYFQRLLVNTITFMALAYLFPNMLYISGFMTAFLASFVLSFLNGFVKPVLHILSLPITILTLGLFSLVINGLMLQLTSFIVGPGRFYVDGFWSAFMIALILSLVNALVSSKEAERHY